MTWHRLRPGHYYAVELDPRVDPDAGWPSGLILAEVSLSETGVWHWFITIRGRLLGPSSGRADSLTDAKVAIAASLQPIYS